MFIQTKSPESTFLVYKFDVYGSKDSLLPKIYDVDAVGIGATNKEFLIPYYITSFLSESQSNLPEGLWFHISNYSIPLEIGDPGNVS